MAASSWAPLWSQTLQQRGGRGGGRRASSAWSWISLSAHSAHTITQATLAYLRAGAQQHDARLDQSHTITKFGAASSPFWRGAFPSNTKCSFRAGAPTTPCGLHPSPLSTERRARAFCLSSAVTLLGRWTATAGAGVEAWNEGRRACEPGGCLVPCTSQLSAHLIICCIKYSIPPRRVLLCRQSIHLHTQLVVVLGSTAYKHSDRSTWTATGWCTAAS